jgi:glucose/arabinose dehydrogenase
MVCRTAVRALALTALASLVACSGSKSSSSDTPEQPPGPPGGLPIESFTAQDGAKFGVQVFLTNLQIPWAMAFAPDGRLFFTERPGRVRVYQNGQLLAGPALTLDDVNTTGESGAMGLALHPDFATNHYVYLSYTANGPAGTINRVMRYRELNNQLAEGIVILDNVRGAQIHNGSRVKFGPDRLLYVTFGDSSVSSLAQDVASLNGKILRMNDDGTSASGNRFSSPVYTYGHRNPQGLAWHPTTGDLWEDEHGQVGNDEINVIDGGNNYGWPVIEANATMPGMVTPLMFFTPSVAPSGSSFYTGAALPLFRNQLFVATLAAQALLRVTIDGANFRHVAGVERLLPNKYGRLRDVVQGPDGFLYISTSNRDGRATPVAEDDRILRIVPLQ